MAVLPCNSKQICASHQSVWDVFYDGVRLGEVCAMTAYDAKRRAESDFDIDDICLLRVVLRSGEAA